MAGVIEVTSALSKPEQKITANFCPRTVRQALLNTHKETGNNEGGPSGQPRTLSTADENHIKLITLRNQKMKWSSWKIAAKSSDTETRPQTNRGFLAATFFNTASSAL